MPRNSADEANHGKRRFKRQHGSGSADYACMDGQKLVKVLEQLTNWGMAVRFGKTKDGGAFALGIYGVDEVPYTEFLPPGENPLDYLIELQDWAESDPNAVRFPADKPIKSSRPA